MKCISSPDLTRLTEAAKRSPRLRANVNLHETLSDPTQRLAIAMEPGTFIPPHRHPQTWEVLAALRGHFIVLLFDDSGTVVSRAQLGGDVSVVEVPPGCWHAVLSRDVGSVVFEVKKGPYRPIEDADIAAWSKTLSPSDLMNQYASVPVGRRCE